MINDGSHSSLGIPRHQSAQCHDCTADRGRQCHGWTPIDFKKRREEKRRSKQKFWWSREPRKMHRRGGRGPHQGQLTCFGALGLFSGLSSRTSKRAPGRATATNQARPSPSNWQGSHWSREAEVPTGPAGAIPIRSAARFASRIPPIRASSTRHLAHPKPATDRAGLIRRLLGVSEFRIRPLLSYIHSHTHNMIAQRAGTTALRRGTQFP